MIYDETGPIRIPNGTAIVRGLKRFFNFYFFFFFFFVFKKACFCVFGFVVFLL